jgi:hypothetical protein
MHFNNYLSRQTCLNLSGLHSQTARLTMLKKAAPPYGELRILIWNVQFCKTLKMKTTHLLPRIDQQL